MTTGDVAADPAGRPDLLTRSLTTRRVPFQIFGTVMVGCVLISLMFAALPEDYASARSLEFQVAGTLAVLGLFGWFVAPRLPGTWGIDACILASGVLAAHSAAVLQEDEGQMVVGFGLVVLGVFAACFLRTWHAMIITTVALLLYCVGASMRPLLSTPAILVSLAAIVLGVTYLVARLVATLRDLALHDTLTGLLNRRGLGLMSEPVLAAAARAGNTVTIGIVDVDSFKQFNDSYGHLAGDELLVVITRSWASAARSSDLLARFGGDEIVVVLVGADISEARELDARARAAFAQACPNDWPHTWTAGFSAWSPGEAVNDVVDRADRELLERKPRRAS